MALPSIKCCIEANFEVAHERAISLLFLCVASILRVFIIFRCEYSKCSTLYNGDAISTICVCFSWEMALSVTRSYDPITYMAGMEYGRNKGQLTVQMTPLPVQFSTRFTLVLCSIAIWRPEQYTPIIINVGKGGEKTMSAPYGKL
jgi:hypothetical protein